MAINLESIKAKLNDLQKNTGKGERQDTLWKPEAGTQVIRIVPYQFNKDNPFNELYFHYEFGNKQYLSPSTFGKPDPVVEFSEKLQSTGRKEDWKLGKKIEPKMRVYAPIVVRGKEHEGVKYWGFGKTVYQELLGFIADPDYGDITDPVNGRDITVEFKTKEQTGKDFPETSIRIKPNQTPVHTDKEIITKIATGQKNLTEIFKEPTYEDLKVVLTNWLNRDTEGVTEEANAQDSAPAKISTPTKPAETKSVEDISSAFDSLFN